MNPPGNEWVRIENIEFQDVVAGSSWKHMQRKLYVIRSISTVKLPNYRTEDWIHVSVSRPDRIPDWEELSYVKNCFFGEEEEAYQVLAAKKDHLNLHSFCLHLWAPIEGPKQRVANLQNLILERLGE